MIARRHTQILVGRRIVDHLELPKEPVFEIGRDVSRSDILDEKGAQPLVPESFRSCGPSQACSYVPLNGTGRKQLFSGGRFLDHY